jgi:hypothetical protein
MKKLSYFFFYTYIGLVILAGFWGAFIYPHFDFNLLFDLNINELTEFQAVNLLSQYRFLRAIELGFGIFSLMFIEQIFTDKKINNLFLLIMLSGVLARMFSLVFDGIPGKLALFFMIYEAIGLVIIFSYTKKKVYGNG